MRQMPKARSGREQAQQYLKIIQKRERDWNIGAMTSDCHRKSIIFDQSETLTTMQFDF
jgi:hypothetical protein